MIRLLSHGVQSTACESILRDKSPYMTLSGRQPAPPATTETSASTMAVSPGVIRKRAILLGAILIIPNNYWVIMMEKVLRGPYPTSISLFANVVFILLCLWSLNRLIRRISPRWALNQSELLLVYTMVAIGSALAGHDTISVMIQLIGHPYQFATPSNGWMERFGSYLPQRLLVSDLEVLKGYYRGASTLYTSANLHAWMTPVLIWSAFFVALMFVFMCINVLVRSQWMDREKLAFPIVYLPLEMSDTDGKLYRNKIMWIGFAIAGGIDFINGLHFLYPNIPEIVVRHVDLLPYIKSKPWTAVGWTPYSFYPFAIGLGYLLPVDLLFSCWFFYIFWKMQLVISNAMAWDALPEFPFIREQCFGGYMAILVFLVYAGRHYLRQVWNKVIGKPSEISDEKEAMSYRSAALGLLLGTGAIAGFFVWIGLSPMLALIGVLLYFALSIAVTRMRAELGPPVHDLHFSGPDHLITRAIGTEAMTPRSLTALTFFYGFNRAYRSHPMPVLAEGLKMADVSKASHRRFMWGMAVATLVGTLAAFWAFLHAAYVYGAAAKFNSGIWFAYEAYNRLNGWIAAPTKPNFPAIWAGVVGFVFCTMLNILRTRMVWFPFHPIGYAISGSWSMNLVWLPLFIAWALKLLTLRFGGLRLYRRAVPLFLGLILGQCIVGSFWSLYGIIFDIPTYNFWGA